MNRRSSWSVVRMVWGTIWIIDLDEPDRPSVTNDAEQVCRTLNAEWPSIRIMYRDTVGRWDELMHEHGTSNWTNALDVADKICAVVPPPVGPRTFPQPAATPPVLDGVPPARSAPSARSSAKEL